MKIGNLPVAPLILIIVGLTSFILNRVYPGEYGFESPFIRGMFLGAIMVYLLYYAGTWISAAIANRKEKAEAKEA